MRLVPLGINGYHPSFGRQTTSFLVTTGEQAFLLDAGTGLGRLAEPLIRKHVERFQSLNIILSHYHLDHIAGLSYLPGIWTNRHVSIYAPTTPFVESTPDAALRRLLAPPYFPEFGDWPLSVDIVPMTKDEFTIGPVQIRIRAQQHPGGSVGIRIDDAIAFMTDTVAETGPLSFAAGARLLVHEAWFLQPVADEIAVRYGHSEISKVMELAEACRVSQLMPMHFDPQIERPTIQETVRGDLRTIIPIEGKSYEV